jgi:hypothetical protein
MSDWWDVTLFLELDDGTRGEAVWDTRASLLYSYSGLLFRDWLSTFDQSTDRLNPYRFG